MGTISGVTGGSVAIASGANGTVGGVLYGNSGGSIAIAGGTSGSFLGVTARGFTIYIGGADRSRFIANPSIEITDQIGARATASFKVIPKDGEEYAPELWDEILIIHNASGAARLFAGFVESFDRLDWTGTSGYYEITVRCSDYGQILDRRLVAKFYNNANGSYASIIGFDIVDKFLQGTGLTYGNLGGDGYVGDDVLFNWRTAAEAFQELADRANLEVRVTPYKVVGFVSKDSGTGSAPFAIEQNDGNWRTMQISQSKTRFANSVKVRNSRDVAALWTDTVEATGEYLYFTQYPLTVKPLILIDGVEVDDALICELSEVGTTPGWQWYYIDRTPGVSFNQSYPAPVGTIDIIYPSRVSYVAIAEDQASIDTYGLYEVLEETKDITNLDALQTYAESILARASVIPVSLSIETDRGGLEPGQLLTVDANGIDGGFLVEQVSMREIARNFPRWTITASNAPQRANRGTAFFTKLMSAARQPVDRIDSAISFTLAETINGDTNVGLEVMTPEAFRTARKGGWIKLVRLGFNSIAKGTLTTSDIVVDILRNGVSIFPAANKLRLRAGRTNPVTRFNFVDAPTPYRIEEGDVFTLDILEADSSAKDGWLDIQVVGE